MKNLISKFILPTLFGALAITIIGSSCSISPAVDERDKTAPVIEVLSPNEGAIFYTKTSLGGASPLSLILEAKATDEFKIIRATATVYDSDNKQYGDTYEELSATQNIPVEVYTSLAVDLVGDYKIVFEFEDINGNIGTETRNVTSYEAFDDEGEEAAKK
ncbi:DUF5011 domain-containing protein [Seonamhaeicola sp. MEBiC1930]|uniref:hypothetical protein n=1 Tax=Seonamhaeicola sp. MEBiC01930 TaxID=2976768 RepID=UPI003254B9DA